MPLSSPNVPPPLRKVCEWELRDLFNDLQFYERLQAGELRAVPKRPPHPTSSATGQEPGTVTEVLEYFDSSTRVALVVQFTKPDGSLGGSGKPDPKRLLVGGEELIPFRDPDRSCPYCTVKLRTGL